MIPPGKNPHEPLPPIPTGLFWEVRQVEMIHNHKLNSDGVPWPVRLLTVVQWEFERRSGQENSHLFLLEKWLKRYNTAQFIQFGEIARREWEKIRADPNGPNEKSWSEAELKEIARKQEEIDNDFLNAINNA